MPRGVDVVTDAGGALSALASSASSPWPCWSPGCAASWPRCARGASGASNARTTTARSSSTRRRFGRILTTPARGSALDRAKLRAVDRPLQLARRRLAATGKLDQALVEYELAARAEPHQRRIDEALRRTRTQLRDKVAVAREGKTELQTLIERARDLPPPGLDLPNDVAHADLAALPRRQQPRRLPAIAALRATSAWLRPDLPRRAGDHRPAQRLARGTRSARCPRRRELLPRHRRRARVLVVPDTPAKRREYEEEVVRTFYLSNADLKETMDLLRIVLDARRISPITATNAHHGERHAGAHRSRGAGASPPSTRRGPK